MQKNRVFLLGLLLFVTSLATATPEQICVRNYIKDPNITWDPCQKSPIPQYAYAVPFEIMERKICTRTYNSFYCETSPKEYVWINTVNGEKVCTVDFNQPGITNYCESAPQYYDYALPAGNLASGKNS